MSLLRHARTVLHGGTESQWKIDCDGFTADDWETCAWLIAQRRKFGRVVGIPRGGDRLAHELKTYLDPKLSGLLIVDDVMTTGDSFREFAASVQGPFEGACVFSRGDPDMHPSWVLPIFQVNPWFQTL